GRLSLRVLGGSEQPVVLARSAEGRYLLIGGSMAPTSLADQVGKTLPPFTRELDFLVIPACGKADVSGLFGLSDEFRIGQVLWACDPERIQTTRRLYQSFQEAQVPQRRLTSADALMLGTNAEAQFNLSEDHLAAMLISQDDFHAQVLFENTAGASEKHLELLILPGAAASEPASASTALQAQIAIFTSHVPEGLPNRLSTHYLPVQAADYTWTEASSDGRQIWLNRLK
ncbi:MAG: hypothetical protein WA110_10850, partial [Anaerolineaceae bacterium]